MRHLQYLKKRLKYYAVLAGLEVTAGPLVQRLLPSARGRGIIFTLHHVRPAGQEGFSPNAHLSVTPEFLEQVITISIESGLTPIHLHDLPDLFADPYDHRRFVAFTLDDGYRNNAEFAAPVFRKYNVPYTIFVNPGFVERSRTMWWKTAGTLTREVPALEFDFGSGFESVQCSTMMEKTLAFDRLAVFVQSIDEDEAVRKIDEAAQSYGIAPMAIVDKLIMTEAELRCLATDPLVHFGAHTVNHVNLRRVSAERLQREIEDSTSLIERYVDQRPRSFSYPYGWSKAVGERESIAVAKAGISVAVTTQPGVLTACRVMKPTELPRVSLNGYFQKKRYVKALISGIPFHMTKTA